jgi:hypothetical protein
VDRATGSQVTSHGVRNAPTWPFVADPTVFAGSAERSLRDAAERAARRPHGKLALALHLSRLPPPAPRPHHGRIARAILHDIAQRHEGQIFSLRNGDLVLICALAREPLALPDVFGRLLRSDAAQTETLTSLWQLEQAAGALLDYAAERLADPAPARPSPPVIPTSVSPLAIDALEAVLRQRQCADITERRMAIIFTGGPAAVSSLRPLFCEVSLAMAALQAQVDGGDRLDADPWLLQHLAHRLDGSLLAAVAAAFGSGSPLDPGNRPAPPIHLNLTLPTLLSPAFADFVRRCRSAGKVPGAEVTLIEAVADPSGFAQARQAAAAAGWRLVLDDVSHHALLLTRPWRLDADLVKLAWSPQLPQLAATEQADLGEALRAIGPSRIVLHHTDDESALRWGFAHGIRRFQGRHIDAVLAASRLLSCPAADGCTLRQCTERGATTGPAGRRFCRQPDLLDAGMPTVAEAHPRP